MLQVENLAKTYAMRFTALEGVNLEVGRARSWPWSAPRAAARAPCCAWGGGPRAAVDRHRAPQRAPGRRPLARRGSRLPGAAADALAQRARQHRLRPAPPAPSGAPGAGGGGDRAGPSRRLRRRPAQGALRRHGAAYRRWRAPSSPARRCCSWMSPSARSTRLPGKRSRMSVADLVGAGPAHHAFGDARFGRGPGPGRPRGRAKDARARAPELPVELPRPRRRTAAAFQRLKEELLGELPVVLPAAA